MLRYFPSEYPLSHEEEGGLLRLYHVARLQTRKPARFLASMRGRLFRMCRRRFSRHSLLLYVHDGDFTVTVDGERRKLFRYDALFIRPGHDVEIFGKEDENGEISLTEFDCLPHFPSLYCKDGVYYARSASALEERIESIERLDGLGRCYAEAALLLALETLSSCGNVAPSANVYARILRYLRLHQGDNMTASDVAEALHQHPSYLNAVCKKHAGKTLLSLIHDYRARAIRAYLGATDLSAERIARILHFKSAQHMSQFFKRKTGMSPTHYRRAHT